jgi:UDP-N-acetylmuramoylalanine--D-glutamate ligase
MLNNFTKNDLVGIWGTGKVGRSAAHFLAQNGINVLFFDEKKIEFCDLDHQIEYDLEVFFSKINYLLPSPGVPQKKYIHKNVKIISEVDLFSQIYKGRSIAITGTVGKTSTVSLISHCLTKLGINSPALGNIGNPLLGSKLTPDDLCVLELSSFQLENANFFSPAVSVIINLYPNHLDHHENYESYKNAKFNIFAKQKSGLIIAHPDLAPDIRTKNYHNLPVVYTGSVAEPQANESYIKYDSEKIFLVNTEHKLIGNLAIKQKLANLANDSLAILFIIFDYFKLDFHDNFINDFKLPAHRAELVQTINGIDFIDDSKSTVVEATLHALAMNTKPTILLLGGVSKGVCRHKIFQKLKDYTHLKQLIFFGHESQTLYQQAIFDFKNISSCLNLEEAVELAKKLARSGDVILFSPSGASFDLFNNYQERGKRFRELINR